VLLLLLLLQFFKEYDKALNEYMGTGENGIGVDLTLVSSTCSHAVAAGRQAGRQAGLC
jgi:hypothetical protein